MINAFCFQLNFLIVINLVISTINVRVVLLDLLLTIIYNNVNKIIFKSQMLWSQRSLTVKKKQLNVSKIIFCQMDSVYNVIKSYRIVANVIWTFQINVIVVVMATIWIINSVYDVIFK
jgi:hypothetical protein